MKHRQHVSEDKVLQIHRMLVLGSSVRSVSEQLRIQQCLIEDIRNGWIRPDLTKRFTNSIRPAISPPWIEADVAKPKPKRSDEDPFQC